MTDWRVVADSWDRMGFPIAECRADGSFAITKPSGTGGLISPATVGEQIVYEIGDPAEYILPDVTCDFSEVHVKQSGLDRVSVAGAKGSAPTTTYKVSATYADGYRSAVTMMIAGRDAVEKAEAVGAAILARSSRLMNEAGYPNFSETSVEVLGGEVNYGKHTRARGTREVILKIAVRHPSKEALQIFGREIYPAAAAMAQGLTGFAGGRPEPQPVIRLFSFLVDKAAAPVSVSIDGRTIDVPVMIANEPRSAKPVREASPLPALDGDMIEVPLIALAHGRSGDKGDIANIGVLARSPEFVPALRRSLTAEAVADYFAHFVKGKVERFDWPGLDGFNFVLHEGLGGGGVASLRHDPQGKALAQILMDIPVAVPVRWLEDGQPLADWSPRNTMSSRAAGAAS